MRYRTRIAALLMMVSLLASVGLALPLHADDQPAAADPPKSDKPAATEPATAALPDKKERAARVRLLGKVKLLPLRSGIKIWDDKKYIFLKIPNQLKDARFIQNPVSMQPKLVMKVLADGYVVVAAPNSGKDKFSRLTDAGWAIIPLQEEFADTCDTNGWTLFRKDCKHGEEMILEVQKYHAPFVILF